MAWQQPFRGVNEACRRDAECRENRTVWMPEAAGRWTSRQTGPEGPERQGESRRVREGCFKAGRMNGDKCCPGVQ